MMLLVLISIIQFILLSLISRQVLSLMWHGPTDAKNLRWGRFAATIALTTAILGLLTIGVPYLVVVFISWSLMALYVRFMWRKPSWKSLFPVTAFHAVWAVSWITVRVFPDLLDYMGVLNSDQSQFAKLLEFAVIALLIQATIPFVRWIDHRLALSKQHVDSFTKAIASVSLILAIMVLFLQRMIIPQIPFWVHTGVSSGQVDVIRGIIIAGIGGFFTVLATGLVMFDALYLRNRHRSEQANMRTLVDMNVREMKEKLETEKNLRFDIMQMSHDLTYRLIPISLLLKEGKTEEAGRVLENMLKVSAISIAPGRGLDPLLDTVLSRATEMANKIGVDVIISVDTPLDCPISSEDLGIILGNALDNAIAACRQAITTPREQIRCFIGRVRGMVVLRIENPYRGIGAPIPGVGLQSIHHIVDKLSGRMHIDANGQRFELVIYLPIRETNQSLHA